MAIDGHRLNQERGWAYPGGGGGLQWRALRRVTGHFLTLLLGTSSCSSNVFKSLLMKKLYKLSEMVGWVSDSHGSVPGSWLVCWSWL